MKTEPTPKGAGSALVLQRGFEPRMPPDGSIRCGGLKNFADAKLGVRGFESTENMQKPSPSMTVSVSGAPAGIRTPDTLLKRQVLCRLSYWGKSTVQKNQNKSLSFVLERRIGGANTKPVGTGEAFTQLRSGASPIRRGWDGGTRTHNIRVKVWCVTVTLRPTV